ncbi:MAG: 50S ribosomal protein L9 [Armatimonadota bacterium]
MKVILTSDVKSLGKKDEIVNVSEGYYRNFLAPRNLAVAAEGTALAQYQKRQKDAAAKEAKTAAEAKALAGRISELKVTVQGKVGAGSKLYGSITSADIAEALAAQHGVKVDKRKIELEEPIKNLGTYNVPVHLHRDAQTTLKVEVTG